MLSFEDFSKIAQDKNLKSYEKVGFNKEHREGLEANIFKDYLKKISNLLKEEQVVLEIGCGCSEPVLNLIDYCNKQKNHLILVDNQGMLNNLPDAPFLEKVPHEFPKDLEFISKWKSKVDIIICYSVIQMVYPSQNVYTFVDKMLSLLKPGGQLFIGDISNISKKKRFLNTEFGKEFHRNWSGSNHDEKIFHNDYVDIDDSVIIQLLLRYRMKGYESYLLPQTIDLPLHFTRDDILITKYPSL